MGLRHSGRAWLWVASAGEIYMEVMNSTSQLTVLEYPSIPNHLRLRWWEHICGWPGWWTVYCGLMVMVRPAIPDSLSQISRMWAKLFYPKIHVPFSSLSWDICDHFYFCRDSGWKDWSPGPQNRDVYIYDGGHGGESVHRLRKKWIRAECIHILHTYVNLVPRNHLTNFNTKLLVECQQEYLESTRCLICS